MAELGPHVNKYQFSATFRENGIDWTLIVELDSRERYVLPIRDGADVPILAELLRGDQSVYFDPSGRRLSTGWNDPGKS